METVLAGLFLEALIVLGVAFVLWLPSVSLPRIPTEWATRPIDKIFARVFNRVVNTWTAPGGHVRVLTWFSAVGLAVVAFVLYYLLADYDFMPDLRAEAVGIAITVIVINELIRYQNRLEYKRSIIRQLGSRSNDFALEAARIAVEEGWNKDGSLKGAFLPEARLEGANLWGAHLEGAFLMDAHLDGASLMEAHLEGAQLNHAHLEGANLWEAHLDGADLGGVYLEGAILGGPYWEEDQLRYIHLKGASLCGAQLEEVYLAEEGPTALDTESVDRFTAYNEATGWPKGLIVPDIATNIDQLSPGEREQFWKEWQENRERILSEATSL